jgi:hypothetical protein
MLNKPTSEPFLSKLANPDGKQLVNFEKSYFVHFSHGFSQGILIRGKAQYS